MDLDKRILPSKKPLTCLDAEQAKLFIGKECYFSDFASKYENLKDIEKTNSINYCKDVLTYVNSGGQECAFTNSKKNNFRYCLPVEWTEEVMIKKKYRPFSLDEFLKIFDIGDQIDFKGKGCCDEVKVAMFTGYITDVDRIDDKTPGACELMLGNFHYSLFSLFEDFELFFDDKWQPFGIEE